MALNTDYDIEKAFRAIEDELIASMIRNLDHHRAEETKEGFNWTQWQVEQIKALERYKAENKKKFKKSFSNINDSIEVMIFAARQAGGTEQEQKILRALKKGLKASKVSQGTEGAFFKLNTRKLNALIKATKSDFNRAEKAMLRMSEDKYRQIIFNAQVYANTGAGTYEKAVDMATKDELMVTVNNRKNNILNIQAMAQEFEKKKGDEMAFMTKGLEMLVGASATAKIEEMDLPLPEYKMLYETIMGVATGTYGEEQTPSR